MINWKRVYEIIEIAVPAVGEMTLYMMIWIFDTMMVGKYGGQLAVSSVGLSTEIIYSFFNILITVGLSTTLTSLISRAIGAKEYRKAKLIANIGIKMGVLIGILFFLVLFLFSKNILTFAGATNLMLPKATRYAQICSFSFLLLSITSTTNGVFRGVKDTKTSLYVAGSINIVNLFLDYVLIFGKFGFPELGITGAAVATVVANIIGFTLQRYFLKRLPFTIDFKSPIYKKEIKEIICLAVPSALQEANFGLSKLFGLTFIMSLGTVAFAANQIGIAIEAVSIMPALGISVATTALVGHSIGEKDMEKVKEYTSYSLIINFIFMGIVSLFFFFLSEELVSLFIQKQDIEVIRVGARCLKIAAFEQISIAAVIIFTAYFKGKGEMKIPFYISFFTNWFLRIPLAYYFISVLKYQVYTFWIITSIQWFLEGMVLYILYRKEIRNK